jgi:hypothetical protein
MVVSTKIRLFYWIYVIVAIALAAIISDSFEMNFQITLIEILAFGILYCVSEDIEI